MKQNIVKTKIKYYRFDISDKEQNKKYLALCETIKAIGLKKDTHHFINFTFESNEEFMNKIKTLEAKGIVEIDSKYIFSNQWNTSAESFNLRIWDWSENIHKNPNIKEGYFLEDVKDLFELRQNTFICGYCGKYYTREQKEKEDISFCYKCLDSEFLTEDNLKLLRLKRINDETTREDLNDCDREVLLNSYHEAQKIGRTKRLNQRIEDKKQSLKDDLKNAKEEYKGFMWLIDNNLDFDNVIYYSHNKEFCFGWRNNLSFEEKQNLKEKLKNFPYKHEFKTQ